MAPQDHPKYDEIESIIIIIIISPGAVSHPGSLRRSSVDLSREGRLARGAQARVQPMAVVNDDDHNDEQDDNDENEEDSVNDHLWQWSSVVLC